MATLLSKVRNITKSTTTETPDVSVVGFLQAAVEHVITSVPKDLLWFLGSESSVSDGNGLTISNDMVLSVSREVSGLSGDSKIPCDQVDYMLSYSVVDTGSLHYATSRYPKYYVNAGKVFIKPDPTATENGYVTSIIVPTISSSTDGDTATYKNIQNLIINYASALDLRALSSYYSVLANSELASIIADVSTALTNFSSALPTWSAQTMDAISETGAADALLKAEQLIDGTVTTFNAQDWIDEEDSEMVQATIQTASQELSRAQGELSKERIHIEKYSQDIQNEVSKNNAAIQKASAYLNEAQTRMQAINTVTTYISKSTHYDQQASLMFDRSDRDIQMFINNNSKMIVASMQAQQQQQAGNQ